MMMSEDERLKFIYCLPYKHIHAQIHKHKHQQPAMSFIIILYDSGGCGCGVWYQITSLFSNMYEVYTKKFVVHSPYALMT